MPHPFVHFAKGWDKTSAMGAPILSKAKVGDENTYCNG